MATALKEKDTTLCELSNDELSSLASGVGTDRRIARTRTAMRSALISLIEERGFDGFTVNDLCNRADLNRGTFYNHFRDKEDVLETFENEVMDDLHQFSDEINKLTLVDLAKIKVSTKPLPFLVELFEYLHEQSDFLHAVLGPGGDLEFAQRVRNTVLTDLIWGLLHERYRKNPTSFVNYYVSFYASAYLGIISTWLESGMKESPEEMARIATRLLFIKPGESITL